MATAETKRPRGRPPAFDRATVVKEAMLVFWANGYEGTSIPALTDAMGISAQSLYAAFGSKDALYHEAIDLYLRTNGAYLANALADEVDPVRAVAQILREAALAVTHQAAGGCMVTTAPSGFDDNDLAKFGRSLRAQGVTAMATSRQASKRAT
jgi:AcrR family transcriptional regulator